MSENYSAKTLFIGLGTLSKKILTKMQIQNFFINESAVLILPDYDENIENIENLFIKKLNFFQPENIVILVGAAHSKAHIFLPSIAKLASEKGINVFSILVLPHTFEGREKKLLSYQCKEKIMPYTDKLWTVNPEKQLTEKNNFNDLWIEGEKNIELCFMQICTILHKHTNMLSTFSLNTFDVLFCLPYTQAEELKAQSEQILYKLKSDFNEGKVAILISIPSNLKVHEVSYCVKTFENRLNIQLKFIEAKEGYVFVFSQNLLTNFEYDIPELQYTHLAEDTADFNVTHDNEAFIKALEKLKKENT